MFNTNYINFHDIAIILAIAAIVNMFAQPLFDRIDGMSADTDEME